MLKIKNSSVINEDFMNYFIDLMKREIPAKQCLELSECIDKLKNQFEVLKRAQIAITSKYCELDKDGNIITRGNNVVFKEVAKRVKCEEELVEIYTQSIEIPLNDKIKIKDSETLSPYKYNLLKEIVEIVPDEPKK